jgi:hypothetical protein
MVSLGEVTLTIPKAQRCSELVFEVGEQARGRNAKSRRSERAARSDEPESVAERVSEDLEERSLVADAGYSASPARVVVGALEKPFWSQLVRPNNVTDRRRTEVPASVLAPCRAHRELCLGTLRVKLRAIRPDVFSEPLFAEYRTAHGHARAPNPNRMDWPLRELGARIHPFGDAAKNPIWRSLLPNRIDCSTEDVIIDLLRCDVVRAI